MKKFLLILFALSSLSFASCSSEEVGGPNRQDDGTTVTPDDTPEVDDQAILAGMEFVADMGVGWNLGNTLDAHGSDETAWGNAYTTKGMIDMIKERGFNTLRIPITWQFHLGDGPDYIVEQAWLERIEEVVNYGLDNDMYVIINIHHDEEIIEPSYSKIAQSITIIESIWQQAATQFKDYGNKLIFETLNEMRVEGSAEEWSGGTAEGRDCINQLHAAAVDVIRATGGNNETRKIMLSTYAASVNEDAMADLEFPDDDYNIIVALHSYTPYAFCLKDEDPTTIWGTQSDMDEIDNLFASIKKAFIDRGHPVIMGEWGSQDHDNDASRALHAAYYAGAAIDNGICPIVWDDGSGFMLYNRHQYKWYHEDVVDAIVNSVK